MKTTLLFLVTLTILYSCKEDDSTTPITNPPEVIGMSFTKSSKTFDESYADLQTSIDNNPNIGIVAEVNHAMNAMSVDLTLNPTRIIFFGNPNLGTPLMQKNQLAGLDLPQKIVVYQNNLQEVYLGFNSTNYLSARHVLDNVDTLPMIQNALTNLSTGASGGELIPPTNRIPAIGEGIVTKTSAQNFENTYTSLQTAIDNNPNLRIIAEVDHSDNALGVGLNLNPTRLIIFGNPNLGTPLMQNSQTIALDLPQKMLVWEDNVGIVHVSYNTPSFLAKRHDITTVNNQILDTISMALDNLSDVAVAN